MSDTEELIFEERSKLQSVQSEEVFKKKYMCIEQD